MNKYEKAWNNVKSLAETSDYYKEHDDKDIWLIEELVEKETPKKPIYKRDKNRYVCGKCEERFTYTRDGIDQYIFSYCPYCGQRADWNEQ